MPLWNSLDKYHMKSLNRNLDSAQYFYHLQKWGKRYGCSERRKTYQKNSRNSSSFLQKVRQELKKNCFIAKGQDYFCVRCFDTVVHLLTICSFFIIEKNKLNPAKKSDQLVCLFHFNQGILDQLMTKKIPASIGRLTLLLTPLGKQVAF